jgi:hypothetical protein
MCGLYFRRHFMLLWFCCEVLKERIVTEGRESSVTTTGCVARIVKRRTLNVTEPSSATD